MSEPDVNAGLARYKARNWDALAALIAALIGVLALLVSGYTAYIQRQQVRAQVWPHIQVGNYDPEHMIGVLNKGVGPAIFRSVQVFVDDRPQRTWKQTLESLGLPSRGNVVSTISDTVISPGERVAAVTIPDEETYRGFRGALGARFGIEICYCSTLDECWIYSDRTHGMRASDHPVDHCTRLPDADTFND